MFDFEKLVVYQTVRELNVFLLKFLVKNKAIDSYLTDQMRRASLSIALNIAEGSGRLSPRDKRRFYIIARSSCFECVAILQVLESSQIIVAKTYDYFYDKYSQISKMLFSLIKKLDSSGIKAKIK